MLLLNSTENLFRSRSSEAFFFCLINAFNVQLSLFVNSTSVHKTSNPAAEAVYVSRGEDINLKRMFVYVSLSLLEFPSHPKTSRVGSEIQSG